MATYKNETNKGRILKNIAMRDEEAKAARLQLFIATNADFLGVSREKLTIHKAINQRNTKIVMPTKKKVNYGLYLKCLESFRVSVLKIK
jgi:hypothetical protein